MKEEFGPIGHVLTKGVPASKALAVLQKMPSKSYNQLPLNTSHVLQTKSGYTYDRRAQTHGRVGLVRSRDKNGVERNSILDTD